VNKEDNLTPYEKGASGNPNGAPKGPHLKTMLNRILAGKDPGKELTRNEEIALAIAKKANEGDVPAARELWDRTDGKVVQVIDQTTTEIVVDDSVKDMLREKGIRVTKDD